MTNLFLSRYHAKKWAVEHGIENPVIVKRIHGGIDIYKIYISIEPHIVSHVIRELKKEGFYHD